eukprot:147522-Prorocentrum_minimum.AAC.5
MWPSAAICSSCCRNPSHAVAESGSVRSLATNRARSLRYERVTQTRFSARRVQNTGFAQGMLSGTGQTEQGTIRSVMPRSTAFNFTFVLSQLSQTLFAAPGGLRRCSAGILQVKLQFGLPRGPRVHWRADVLLHRANRGRNMVKQVRSS